MISPAFKKRVLEIREEASEIEFFIVIWGPGGGSNHPARRKRLQLRKSLSEAFGQENVIFPEE